VRSAFQSPDLVRASTIAGRSRCVRSVQPARSISTTVRGLRDPGNGHPVAMSDISEVSEHSQTEFVRVAELLARAQGDMAAALGELTDTAVKVVPGAQHAGITIAGRSGDVETAAASGACAVVLSEVERSYGEGPGLAAASERRRVTIDDVTTDERWPRCCGALAEQTPIRSVMSFGLSGDANGVGALTFCAESVGAFGDKSAVLGFLLATYTSPVLDAVRRDQQFRGALASRDIVGQAKGMLMERFGIGATAAFRGAQAPL